MSEAISVAIAVPIRNERDRLPHLLQALADQAGAPPFTLCCFFDSCTDGSAELVATLAPRLRYAVHSACVGAGGAPNAGAARGQAMALALRAASNGILLTTDADGEPAPDWIAANLAALQSADIVAGRIERGSGAASQRQDRIEAYYHRLHLMRRTIDPVMWEPATSHHWASGASLALHAETYRTLGGFPPQANGEDAALCDIAERRGLRVRRDAAISVRTSARRHGRADNGFAAALRALDRGEMPTITHPEDEIWRFRRQAEARRLHGSGDYARLADMLGLCPTEVAQVAAECSNGTAFAARIVGAPPQGLRAMPFDVADRMLSQLEQPPLSGAA